MSCFLPYLPPPPFLLFYMLIAAGTVSRQFKPFYRPLVHSFMTNLVLLTSPLHKPRSPVTSWQPKAAAQTFQLHLEALCHQNFIFSTETWQGLFGLMALPMFRTSAQSLKPISWVQELVLPAIKRTEEYLIPPLKEKFTRSERWFYKASLSMEDRRDSITMLYLWDFLIPEALVCDLASSAVSSPTTLVSVVMMGHGYKYFPNVLWKFSVSKILVQKMKNKLFYISSKC